MDGSRSLPRDPVQKFLHDANTFSVDNPRTSSSPSTPTWIKPELMKIGQEFIQQHFFAIYFSHFISLLLLFCYEPVRIILLRTEKSAPSSKSLRRYFSTLSHLKLWYEGNLLDEDSPSSKDIQTIRKVHSNVAKAMGTVVTRRVSTGTMATASRQDQPPDNTMPESSVFSVNGLDINNNEIPAPGNIVIAVQRDFIQNQFLNPHQPPVYANNPGIAYPVISQLDMIITQFCFMGLISLYPRIFGVIPSTRAEDDGGTGHADGLAGFLHIWALIGHRLGIDDRFNLCVDTNEFHAKQKISIAQDVYLRSLVSVSDKQIPTTTTSILTLWQSLVAGIASFIPFISLPAILSFFMVHILGFKDSRHTNQYVTLYDRLCLQIMGVCFNSWLRNAAARYVFNQLLRIALVLTSIRLYYLVPAIRMLKKLSVH